ncbi:MAG: hypothetical protein EHM58_00760 [Ignavibacteriae bacterium]|nr:MAG: hypothetical protein EHM58_00760 [Ignavibacteriota bacterium]
MESTGKNDSLYKLVKSLTKTEKAYFKKFASRHVLGDYNKYTLLFDAIAVSKNGYDENEIKDKFPNEKFVKNFPVIKNYLANMILKSLNSFYSDSTPDNEIKNDLRYIKILYKKALFEQCRKIVESSLKRAYLTDNFLMILELLNWKKNLINEDVYEGNQFINLEKAYCEEQDIIRKMKNLSDYRMLSYRARSISVGFNPYYKGDDTKEELLNILNDPLLQSEKEALSYPARIAYYHVFALVNECIGKNLEAFECRKQLLCIMEENPDTIKGNISNYIISIFNLLGTCFGLRAFNELENYINKLRTIKINYPGKISGNDLLIIFLGTMIFELKMQIKKGEFSKLVQNINEIEDGLKEFEKMIVKEDLLYCFYMLAYSYFGAGKYDEALNWVNRIFNEKETDCDTKLQTISKILNIIIHYELDNYELLEYLIKSAYRYFRKNGSNSIEGKIIIDFFKQLPSITYRDQLKELFAESLGRIRAGRQNADNADNKTNPFEIQNNFTNSAEFDLESWLESKVNGKSFEEIVRSKYLKKIKAAQTELSMLPIF